MTSGSVPPVGNDSIAIADFPIGAIRPVSTSVCVARLGTDHFAAIDRRCPHMGGDLACGWIDEGKVVCPLHSLPFDPHTGASPCSSLSVLRRYAYSVRDGRIHVDVDRDARVESVERRTQDRRVRPRFHDHLVRLRQRENQQYQQWRSWRS
jgi:nitrite reductase/ring-hydroxylating ferredoxin subunit